MSKLFLGILFFSHLSFSSTCYQKIIFSPEWGKRKPISQLEEVEKFIKNLWNAANPNFDLLNIKEIEICPRCIMGRSARIILRDRKLFITPQNIFRMPSVLSADQIRELWDSGHQFAPKSVERKLWPYLNPLGFFQKTVRSTLHRQSENFSIFLKSLLPQKIAPHFIVSQLISYLSNSLSATPEQLEPILVSLAGKNSDELSSILKSWLEHLQNPNNIQLTADADVESPQKTFTQNIYGLITVGNYHRIRISVHSGSGAAADAQTYPHLTANIQAIGLIAIHTVDDVEVKVDYHALGFILSGFHNIIKGWQNSR